MSKSINIVIPIYNEQGTIPELWQRLYSVVQTWEYRTQIIFVNDGSQDASFQILTELHQQFPKHIAVVHLTRNFGHQSALTAGIEHAHADAVILMDGDLQDTPESLPQMLRKWEEGFKVVYAIRTKRKETFLKRFAFTTFYRLQAKLTQLEIPLDAGIFSLMDKQVVDIFKQLPEKNRYIPGLRTYLGFQQIGIPIERGVRFEGKPRVSTTKLIKLAMDGIFSMSHLPLRIASYLGIMIASCSFLLATIVIFLKIIGLATPGWASNLSSTFFMGGIQLIFLGIIGEYLGRIYDEVKQRPYYIVQEKIGFESSSESKLNSN